MGVLLPEGVEEKKLSQLARALDEANRVRTLEKLLTQATGKNSQEEEKKKNVIGLVEGDIRLEAVLPSLVWRRRAACEKE